MSAGPRRPVTPPRRQVTKRLAFCPLCGGMQSDKAASDVGKPEDALCADRCAAAWSVLAALRASESTSAAIALRRRAESEAHEAHAPVLSELLLQRWRAGDWRVRPEDVRTRLAPPG